MLLVEELFVCTTSDVLVGAECHSRNLKYLFAVEGFTFYLDCKVVAMPCTIEPYSLPKPKALVLQL